MLRNGFSTLLLRFGENKCDDYIGVPMADNVLALEPRDHLHVFHPIQVPCRLTISLIQIGAKGEVHLFETGKSR